MSYSDKNDISDQKFKDCFTVNIWPMFDQKNLLRKNEPFCTFYANQALLSDAMKYAQSKVGNFDAYMVKDERAPKNIGFTATRISPSDTCQSHAVEQHHSGYYATDLYLGWSDKDFGYVAPIKGSQNTSSAENNHNASSANVSRLI